MFGWVSSANSPKYCENFQFCFPFPFFFYFYPSPFSFSFPTFKVVVFSLPCFGLYMIISFMNCDVVFFADASFLSTAGTAVSLPAPFPLEQITYSNIFRTLAGYAFLFYCFYLFLFFFSEVTAETMTSAWSLSGKYSWLHLTFISVWQSLRRHVQSQRALTCFNKHLWASLLITFQATMA